MSNLPTTKVEEFKEEDFKDQSKNKEFFKDQEEEDE